MTADGLTVDGDAAVAGTTGVTADNGTITTGKDSASSRTHWSMNNPNGEVAKWDSNGTDLLHYITDEYKVYTAGNKAFEIDGNGDISFYEDTGTTAKLFWDASAESLGIGTSSPATQLHVNASSGDVEHRIEAAGSGNDTILSLKNLNTGAGAEGHIRFMDGATTAGAISYLHNAGGVSDAMTFYTASSEAMRIDSSGNLLVGMTNDTPGLGDTDTGASFRADGASFVSRTLSDTSGSTFYVNRNTNDGNLIQFQKDGSVVGSIGVDYGDNLFISGNSTHVGLMFDSTHIWPYKNGNFVDATVDLGVSSGRFKDLYLSGGAYLGGVASANLLDDYEEGTCDLTWSDGTNNSTVVTNKYTKVGRIVTVSGYVSGNVSGLTGTAVAKIAGFPFAFSDYGSFAVKLRYIDSPTGCIGIVGNHVNSGSVAQLSFIIDNGNYVDVLVSDLSTNSNDTYFNITYTAT